MAGWAAVVGNTRARFTDLTAKFVPDLPGAGSAPVAYVMWLGIQPTDVNSMCAIIAVLQIPQRIRVAVWRAHVTSFSMNEKIS